MITQQTETTKRELTTQEGQATAKKLFVEPEISGPVNVLEATAFFQVFTGPSDPGVGVS